MCKKRTERTGEMRFLVQDESNMIPTLPSGRNVLWDVGVWIHTDRGAFLVLLVGF